jgi:hypothetical protein
MAQAKQQKAASVITAISTVRSLYSLAMLRKKIPDWLMMILAY